MASTIPIIGGVAGATHAKVIVSAGDYTNQLFEMNPDVTPPTGDATVYVVVCFMHIVFIRREAAGFFLVWLVFLTAWMTDTFAYTFGMLFGKHKLIEDVSPKKTIEGSIGGTFFCAASYLVSGILAEIFLNCNANLIFLTISGVFISVIAQVGDLIMSVIKRHYGIKDYGKIFPGHGGMLDRFDSILAVVLGMVCICMFVSLTGITLI